MGEWNMNVDEDRDR